MEDDRSLLAEVSETLRARLGAEVHEALTPLLEEVWCRATSDRARGDAPMPDAARLGAWFAERAVALADGLRQLLSAGRELIDAAQLAGSTAPSVGLLRRRFDEAVAQVVEGFQGARRARREAWSSFHVHELKNPLNTLVNALWLLREKGTDSPQATRFFELADRAVKRLEERIGALRALDEQQRIDPPRQGRPVAPG